MMPRSAAVGLAATASLAALLAFGPTAGAAEPTGHTGGERVLRFLETTTSETFIDIDKDGNPSVGDEFIFTADLSQDSQKVGADQVVCTITSLAGNGTTQCLATLSLKDGDITVQAAVPDFLAAQPADFDAAVTGGTGAYSTARGSLHIHNTSETEADLTLHLIC